MDFIILVILEIVPIILWACGWYFENKYSKYPDVSRGYKFGSAKNSNLEWEYGNKVASKVFSTTGTLLFTIIIIARLLFDINIITIIFILFIVICANFMIIEGIIKKKFKKKDLQIRTYVCIMKAYRDRSGGRTGLKVNFYAIMPHDTNLYYRKII